MTKRPGQNRSSAVMAQRHEAIDSLDDFPTPPWATRALCEFLESEGIGFRGRRVKEPCANRGYMARPLAEYSGKVIASDIFDYGAGYPVRDYLSPMGDLLDGPQDPADDVATNPPYNKAVEFVLQALRDVLGVVAVFLRSNWTEGADRYHSLFHGKAPTFQLQFSERVILTKGRLLDPDRKYRFPVKKKPGQFEWRKPSTATSYCWFIWDPRRRVDWSARTTVVWVPPGTRQALTRPGDYDVVGKVSVMGDDPREADQDDFLGEVT